MQAQPDEFFGSPRAVRTALSTGLEAGSETNPKEGIEVSCGNLSGRDPKSVGPRFES